MTAPPQRALRGRIHLHRSRGRSMGPDAPTTRSLGGEVSTARTRRRVLDGGGIARCAPRAQRVRAQSAAPAERDHGDPRCAPRPGEEIITIRPGAAEVSGGVRIVEEGNRVRRRRGRRSGRAGFCGHRAWGRGSGRRPSRPGSGRGAVLTRPSDSSWAVPGRNATSSWVGPAVMLSGVTKMGSAALVKSHHSSALAWLCAWLLALTWTACSSEPRRPQSPAPAPEPPEEMRGEPCTYDGDCTTEFCDRGFCADADETKGHYGWACESNMTPPIAHVNPCGGYLCIDQRCRSCQSDGECRKYRKGPTCAKPGDWPGKGCGDYSRTGPAEPATPPPPPASELPPK